MHTSELTPYQLALPLAFASPKKDPRSLCQRCMAVFMCYVIPLSLGALGGGLIGLALSLIPGIATFSITIPILLGGIGLGTGTIIIVHLILHNLEKSRKIKFQTMLVKHFLSNSMPHIRTISILEQSQEILLTSSKESIDSLADDLLLIVKTRNVMRNNQIYIRFIDFIDVFKTSF